MRLMIECWGTDVTVSVYDPSDKLLSESHCYRRSVTPISLLSDAGGSYRLEIGAPEAGSITGRYELRIEMSRRQAAQDRIRLAGEKAFAEAAQLQAKGLDEDRRAAILKYEEARVRFLDAGDLRAEAYARKNSGKLYESLNDFHQALTFYNQALALSRRVNDSRLRSDLLNCIGYLYCKMGENQKGLESANRGLTLSRAAANRSGEAQALYTIGDIYYGFGNIRKALDYYEQAIQIARWLYDYQGQADVLVSFGYAYVETGDIQKAFDSYQRALALSRHYKDGHAEAVTLRALGNLHTKLGESQMAFVSFLKALELLQAIDDSYLKATIYGGLGYAYERVGEQRRALEYYNQALAILKEIRHPWGEAEMEQTIGEAYSSLNEPQVAMEHFQVALSLFRSLKISRYEGFALSEIGKVYDSQGDKDKALEYYNLALKKARAGQDQRYQAYTLNYIGRIYESAGARERALAYYRQALSFNRIAADPSGESLSLYNIAHVERDLGGIKEALTQIEAALKIAESLRAKVASTDLRAAYFTSARQYYELYIDILMQMHQAHPGEGFDSSAFNASERARARVFLDLLKEARVDIRQGVDATLLARERALKQTLNAKIQRRIQLLADKRYAEASALDDEISLVSTQYDEVKLQIKTTSPRYASLMQPEPLGLGEIQRQVLDDRSLLLEYALGEERSYLWAVTRTEISTFELAGKAEIEQAARRLYGLLTARQPLAGESDEQYQARITQADAQVQPEIAALSKLLLGPVAERLDGKRLLIVPDGALQYIPFQALVIPETGGRKAGLNRSASALSGEPVPLIVSCDEVISEPSASVLALLRGEGQRDKALGGTVAVLADPVFETDDPRIQSTGAGEAMAAGSGSRDIETQRSVRSADFAASGGRIPRLLASREEAETIMAFAPPREGLLALGFEAARQTAMRPELKQYRIVHFATHAVINSEHPELSGIILSLVNHQGQPQDGFLSLDDIYNLNLSADLVVLSACQTGLGEDVKGEGLVGLTRGFMHAGASSVVASLWKVDDAATAELMKNFYKFMLKDGLPPAAALRQSQLMLWRHKSWHAPYYWAGFVLQGQYELKARSSYQNDDKRTLFIGLAIAAIMLSFSACYVLRKRQKSLPRTKPRH
jgi:tetratricopeptide (TPR) repeat protein